ncbi:MAG TPA: GTPase Era [Acidimicrobiia bacterium]|nr:GTPase Era [Acidimicrobiia bacterium]
MRSGFVSVVGRPNVGKSTLVNRLVGHKVSITSSRPQTTRSTIRGVLTRTDESGEPQWQMVLVDTPGLHKPRTELGSRLNRLVYGSLGEADAVVFVIDATEPIGPGDRLIAERVSEVDAPVVLAVNKIDAAGRAQVITQLSEAAAWDFAAYVPVSALEGDGLDALVTELEPLLPEGPLYFPPDQWSDQPESLVIAELIREKFLERLRDELPHSLMVRVEDMDERDDGLLTIHADVIVERKSQRGIVIGKGGSLLQVAGSEARQDLERLFGTRVNLQLQVTVEKDWQRRPVLLDRLGFQDA